MDLESLGSSDSSRAANSDTSTVFDFWTHRFLTFTIKLNQFSVFQSLQVAYYFKGLMLLLITFTVAYAVASTVVYAVAYPVAFAVA